MVRSLVGWNAEALPLRFASFLRQGLALSPRLECSAQSQLTEALNAWAPVILLPQPPDSWDYKV